MRSVTRDILRKMYKRGVVNAYNALATGSQLLKISSQPVIMEILVLALLIFVAVHSHAQNNLVKHVVLISIDGLRRKCLRTVHGPQTSTGAHETRHLCAAHEKCVSRAAYPVTRGDDDRRFATRSGIYHN